MFYRCRNILGIEERKYYRRGRGSGKYKVEGMERNGEGGARYGGRNIFSGKHTWRKRDTYMVGREIWIKDRCG